MHEIYLVDGSCFIYRAYHAIKGLSTSRGIPTNAIYGFTRMLLKLLREKNVKYILCAFDSPHPTKRHKIYEEYKITRPETPKDLPVQIDYIKQIIDALGITRIEVPGYEADDIIATAVGVINQFAPLNFIIISIDKDMLQLVSDNVKIYDPINELIIDREYVIKKYGVPPEKLNDFMALVGDAIDNIPGVKGIGEKTAANLIKRYGSIENILKNLDIIKPLKVSDIIKKNIKSLQLSKELVILRKDTPIEIKLDDLKIKQQDREKLVQIFRELEFNTLLKQIIKDFPNHSSCSVLQLNLASENRRNTIELIEKIKEYGKFSVTFNKDSIIAGVNGTLYEIAFNDTRVNEILSSEILKIIYNAKEALKKLKNSGLKLSPPYFDLMIVAYLINPNRGKYNIDELILEYTGKFYENAENINFYMFELYEKLNKELKEKELENLYFDIEMPLIEVLFDMEETGIKVNIEKLETLTKHISMELDKIKEKIYTIAGTEFNINSPKQLAEVLYDRLGLKTRKRGKKARSTEMEVLEELAIQHELPHEVINYRTLNKLLTGYLIPLRDYINPETKRIHTKWSQTVAGTGRIVSSEPNLQNIPVKGEWAEFLREVFIPENGYMFLSADYSQIELRLLAHMSEDPALIKAFLDGKDIHTATASEIFSIPENAVTDEHRRIAKTVNFGISYGISPFGLSESIKIPYEKAEELIELYFLRYPMVRKFIDETINSAKQNGYVRTLFGRIRPLPEINSPNQFLRMQSERMAVNARVQGTAADIIKIAMIRIYNRLKKEQLNAKIILQIHDEIVLEVEQKVIENVSEIVQNEMKAFSLSVPLEVNVFSGNSLNL
ncbi:DNA polymerase I [Thermodesulfovibrio yellowstonii]|uniref:DNA polymerase I n=1 Tax=Thermodesulfovibrio yellowstonii TaxID=28262 RepID=A0A9W6GFU9_9BACT|nr:DNA polymerase I [Thermodesulfovibrio islandicus]GLI53126.1 DNA polymerase [Thermodesulfovibrio islandicus]